MRTILKENNTGGVTKRSWSTWLIGWALLIATLAAAYYALDIKALIQQLVLLPRTTLLTILLLGSASWVLRGLRTWILVSPFAPMPLITALGVSFVHNTANNLLPMRLGELVFPWLTQRLGSPSFLTGLGALLWIRGLDLIALLGLGGMIMLWPVFGFPALAATALIVFALPLVLGWLVPRSAHWPLPTVVERVRDQFVMEAQNPRRLAQLWRLTVLSWLSKLLAMMILLATLSGLGLAQVMSLILGAELSAILPIHGLAGAGSYEAGGILGGRLSGTAFADGF
ncbi:MAG: hypothetical protein EBS77_08375, partial [Gammaproteobacteria bacterium]|nr:hypothetical protein [Gammaproteobacteria bacterium]